MEQAPEGRTSIEQISRPQRGSHVGDGPRTKRRGRPRSPRRVLDRRGPCFRSHRFAPQGRRRDSRDWRKVHGESGHGYRIDVLAGAEDLAPVRPDGSLFEDAASAPGFTIRRYRPRIDALFARIERWTENATGESHWRSITRDNITTLYGKVDESRIFAPSDAGAVSAELADAMDGPLFHLFSLRHDFPNKWQTLRAAAGHAATFTITKERFPFLVQGGTINVAELHGSLILREPRPAVTYKATLTPGSESPIDLTWSASAGHYRSDMKSVTLAVSALPADGAWRLQLVAPTLPAETRFATSSSRFDTRSRCSRTRVAGHVVAPRWCATGSSCAPRSLLRGRMPRRATPRGATQCIGGAELLKRLPRQSKRGDSRPSTSSHRGWTTSVYGR